MMFRGVHGWEERTFPSRPSDTTTHCFFLLFRQGLFLFNDWLASYKEALHYATVQQTSETEPQRRRLPGSHGRSRWKPNGLSPMSLHFRAVLLRFVWVKSSPWANPGSSPGGKCTPLMTHVCSTCPSIYRRWNILNVAILMKSLTWHGAQGIPKQWKGFF